MPKAEGYQNALMTSLTRIIGEWTAPDFLSAVVAREGVNLDPAAITMVTFLSTGGPQRPSTLAAKMVTGASNVSKVVARLTAAGMVTRIPDPADARAGVVSLTAAGHRVANSFVRAGDGLVEDLLQDWTDQDRTDLVRLLNKLERSTSSFSQQLRNTPSVPAQTVPGDTQGAKP
ncbi:MAG: MarR family winged helix-turn-helix transcriptional regulator [Specibacter sp.]